MEPSPHDLEEPIEPQNRIEGEGVLGVGIGPLNGYFKSRDARELAACASFLLLSTVVLAFDRNFLRERPIPVQYLYNSDEYVVSLSHAEPFDGETVPDVMLYVLAVLFPLVCQGLSAYYNKHHFPNDIHKTLCVYMVAFAIVVIATEGIKVYVGYLRPIFFDLCEPDQDYQSCTGGSYGHDLRKSFPSGHSSVSFCGLYLLSLYLHTRFGLPSVDASQTPVLQPYRQRFVSILALLPLALATFIAASRIADNKHFPADIVAGAILGASSAQFVHSLWYV